MQYLKQIEHNNQIKHTNRFSMQITHTIKNNIFRIEVAIPRVHTVSELSNVKEKLAEYLKPFHEEYTFDADKVERLTLNNISHDTIYIEQVPCIKKTPEQKYMECLEVFLDP